MKTQTSIKKLLFPIDYHELTSAIIIAVLMVYPYLKPSLLYLDPLFILISGHSFSGRDESIQRFVSWIFLILIIIMIYALLLFISRHVTITKNRFSQLLVFIAALVSPLPLYSLSFHMRPILDDFSFINRIRNQSLLSAIINFYRDWSGRYMTPPITWIANLFPIRISVIGFPILIHLMTMTGISVLFFTFIRSFSSGMNSDKNPPRLLSIIAGCCFASSIFLITPSAFSSLYWFSGGVVYGFGIVMAIFSFMFLFLSMTQNRHSCLFLILSLTGLIAACGSNELTAISLCVLSLSTLIYVLFFPMEKKSRKKYVIIFFIISIIATLVSLISPGNRIRASYFPEGSTQFSLTWVFVKIIPGITNLFILMIKKIFEKSGIFLIFTFLFLFMGSKLCFDKKQKRLAIWAILTFIIAAYFCFLPNSMIQWIPDRAMVIPISCFQTAVFLLAILTGSLTHSQKNQHFSFTNLVFILLITSFECLAFYKENIESCRKFSLQSDFREKMILQQKNTTAVIETCSVDLLFDELMDLTDDPNFYVNIGMAEFYDLDRITAMKDCSVLIGPSDK